MGKRMDSIPQHLKAFIDAQKLFFVGTASHEGRVNISPKGMDSLRVISPKQVVWLNVTGSGNETSAHIQEFPRMTLMFLALEGNPMILRVYGTAKVYHPFDPEWETLFPLFKDVPGARQIFDLTVDLVQTSCGTAVPLFDFKGERDHLSKWASKQGKEGIRAYWKQKNQISLDGKPTFIMEKNSGT